MKPMDIEKESFAIIEKELTTDIPAEYKPVVKRVIHTTADFSYETSMTFSKGVIEEALKAIKEGVDIVTDTNMAKSGISHKWQRSFLVRLIVIWQTVMLPVKLQSVRLQGRQSVWRRRQRIIQTVLWL